VHHMRLELILLLLGFCLALESLPNGVPESERAAWKLFNGFMHKFERQYTNHEERLHRFAVFKDNLKRADDLNVEHDGVAKFGVTKFSDLTLEEFLATYARLNITDDQLPPVNRSDSDGEGKLLGYPAVRDWRQSPARVTSVKNQGQCGSCWAFATVAEFEGRGIQYGGYIGDLSEQQLVDCDGGSNGCSGGYVTSAMSYVSMAGAVAAYGSYPYLGYKQSYCHYSTNMQKYAFSGWAAQVGPDLGSIYTQVGNNRPVTAALDATLLQLYTSGILVRPTSQCTSKNHAVLIAGYDSNQSYFIVKNSWAANWGVGGYFYMGTTTCQINTSVYRSYP